MPRPDGTLDTATDDAVEAGLDALDTPPDPREGGNRGLRLARVALPPLVALALAIAVWQALWAAAFWPEFKLPAPLAVWDELRGEVVSGAALGYVWTSVSRAVIGFIVAIVIATPLGLLVAKVQLVRAAL